MKTSANGRAFIEQWEGLFLHNYNDGVGVQTIGYGHTSAAGPPRVYHGMTITREQADAILASDLTSVELNVNHHVKVPLTQNQFDVCVSFDFNTGGLDRSSLLHAINYNLPITENLVTAWSHGGGRFIPGLYNRRVAEWKLFHKPVVTDA